VALRLGGDAAPSDWLSVGAEAMARPPAKRRAGADTIRMRIMVMSSVALVQQRRGARPVDAAPIIPA
jgi:hypothetical protein